VMFPTCLFVWCTVWCPVLMLRLTMISWCASAAALNSWTYWLWNCNSSPPPSPKTHDTMDSEVVVSVMCLQSPQFQDSNIQTGSVSSSESMMTLCGNNRCRSQSWAENPSHPVSPRFRSLRCSCPHLIVRVNTGFRQCRRHAFIHLQHDASSLYSFPKHTYILCWITSCGESLPYWSKALAPARFRSNLCRTTVVFIRIS
jgi:hypothetical protein